MKMLQVLQVMWVWMGTVSFLEVCFRGWWVTDNVVLFSVAAAFVMRFAVMERERREARDGSLSLSKTLVHAPENPKSSFGCMSSGMQCGSRCCFLCIFKRLESSISPGLIDWRVEELPCFDSLNRNLRRIEMVKEALRDESSYCDRQRLLSYLTRLESAVALQDEAITGFLS